MADELTFEALAETLDLASSYARSAAECAWRNDREFLRLHLIQTSRAATEALQTFAALLAGGPL